MSLLDARFRRIAYEDSLTDFEVLYEGQDPNAVFSIAWMKYLTTGLWRDMLREQEDIVKLWIKQQNLIIKENKNKLGSRNIKVNLSELLNQLVDFDSKCTKTKQTLLKLESYIKRITKLVRKNGLELMVENQKDKKKWWCWWD